MHNVFVVVAAMGLFLIHMVLDCRLGLENLCTQWTGMGVVIWSRHWWNKMRGRVLYCSNSTRNGGYEIPGTVTLVYKQGLEVQGLDVFGMQNTRYSYAGIITDTN